MQNILIALLSTTMALIVAVAVTPPWIVVRNLCEFGLYDTNPVLAVLTVELATVSSLTGWFLLTKEAVRGIVRELKWFDPVRPSVTTIASIAGLSAVVIFDILRAYRDPPNCMQPESPLALAFVAGLLATITVRAVWLRRTRTTLARPSECP